MLTESVIFLSQVTQVAEAEGKTRHLTTVDMVTFCTVWLFRHHFYVVSNTECALR